MQVSAGYVAPYVGAWIETYILTNDERILKSHPTWVRGLKPYKRVKAGDYCVAPYVGAWIETTSNGIMAKKVASHPTWVRGLKL